MTSLTQHIWSVSGLKFVLNSQTGKRKRCYVCSVLSTVKYLSSPWWLSSRRALAEMYSILRFCLGTGFYYQRIHKQNMNWNNQLTPLSLSLMPSFIEIYSLCSVEFLTSNFIKCHACKHSIVLTVQGTQTHFLLRMYDGEEISTCMFLPLLINCKLQISSLIFK